MHIYGSRDNDLPPGTARPSQFRVDGPPFVSAFVKGMIGIEERDDNVHVKQDAHELHAFPVPQSLHVFQRNDFATRGQNRYTPRIADLFFRPRGGAARPRRAKSERTFPAVRPSRWASSLAALSTSSSISRVVLMHLMLLHHCITVKCDDDH